MRLIHIKCNSPPNQDYLDAVHSKRPLPATRNIGRVWIFSSQNLAFQLGTLSLEKIVAEIS